MSPQSPPAVFARAPEEVLAELGTSVDGLTAGEAARRLRVHGTNDLLSIRPVSAWRVLWDQLRSTVVALLLVAAIVGLALGDHAESVAVLIVLAVNLILGFTTEWKARSAMEALRRTVSHQASVVRDGIQRDVDARELVPGDVLVLEAGESVAADARVLEAQELRVVEAALTGESAPCGKRPDPVEAATVLAERSSMVWKGTLVAAGSGRAVITATGRSTEIGRIGELVAGAASDDTPLEQRLAVLGRQLVVLTLGIALAVALIGVVQGRDVWLMTRTGIALAIAAVPEGLPVVATICLALGMRKMARRNALIRRLPAVETLGSVTVVCTDKTGTLTASEMTVTEVWIAGETVPVTGTGYAPEGTVGASAHGSVLTTCLRIGAVVNDATLARESTGWSATGDPTEIALLVAAHKHFGGAPDAGDGNDRATLPFSSERMWMARRTDGELHVKGAASRILDRSSSWESPEGPRTLTDGDRRYVNGVADEMALRGLRVLAVAIRTDCPRDTLIDDDVADLRFVGLFGITDPPADGVKEAVHALREAGVRPVMITGDHRLTALAIAHQLGIARPGDEALDGRDLDALDDEALTDKATRVSVFSRVSPEGKLRIVNALRGAGEIVGMLGDGVNDAPALKRADVGVAMGVRGTDVAKETAALVLQDDRFATVVAAVEEGRVIFDNIRKFIFFLFSCNLSEVALLCSVAAAGMPLPLLPLQILWLNFVTDVFPALALAAEPKDADVLRRPPRDPDEAVLSRGFLRSLVGHAALLTISAVGAFLVSHLGGASEETTRTITFMTVALGQTLHALNARSDRPILLTRTIPQNRWMLGAILLVLALQAIALFVPPLREALGLVLLDAEAWGLVVGASVLPLLVGQAVRWRAHHRDARDAGHGDPAVDG